MVSALISEAEHQGFEVTLGEAYRPPEMCEIYAKRGTGTRTSLHGKRLAIDINLFKNGNYLTKTSDYQSVGLWWEEKGGSWGGQFGDGNHFSLSPDGGKTQ
jgi:hypothetical protein